MAIETSTVVEFGEGSDGEYIFFVEPDEVSNGEDFDPIIGDSVVYKVNHSSNVQILRVIATDGNVRQTGSAVREVDDEEVLFKEDDESNPSIHRLSVSPTSVSYTFLGRQGILVRSNPIPSIVEFTGDISRVPFRAKFHYRYNCLLFTLVSPTIALAAEEVYNIDVVFYIRVN